MQLLVEQVREGKSGYVSKHLSETEDPILVNQGLSTVGRGTG